MDDGALGCNRNHLKAWTWLQDSPQPWSVVLEDDAVPVEDFRTQLTQALQVAPHPVVSLYLGTGHPIHQQSRIKRALDRAADAHWLTGTTVNHAVALAIKTELIPQMLPRITRSNYPIDQAISMWAKHCAYTLPSLVNHNDHPSLSGRRRSQYLRHAWCTGTHEQWNDQTVRL